MWYTKKHTKNTKTWDGAFFVFTTLIEFFVDQIARNTRCYFIWKNNETSDSFDLFL